MAALALDQGEGKHSPGRALAPSGRQQGPRGASGACSPPPGLAPPALSPGVAGWSVPTTARGGGRPPCRPAPPPWAGPGRLPRPAGGARPGAAPGLWPRKLRPLPAPFPPSSTPGVGDPEARRASGWKLGDAVVDTAAAGASAAAQCPLSPFPRPRALVCPPAEPRRVLRAPLPDAAAPRASPDCLDSRLRAVFFPRTDSEGAAGEETRPPPERSGPARERFLVEEPAECRPGARPPTGPSARGFLMQTAVH